MRDVFTPPFPIVGAGMVLGEATLAAALVASFWVTYPAGFAELGVILAGLLLASWFVAHSLGARVLLNASHRDRAKTILVIGSAFGFAGLVLGFLGGPHVAGVAVYGVGLQLAVLLAGRAVCAT
jgi:hypothetical protein